MRVPDYFDRYDDERNEEDTKPLRCKRCGSTDVRWRQQGGKWTLFAMEPGKLHVCEIDDSDFNEVKE